MLRLSVKALLLAMLGAQLQLVHASNDGPGQLTDIDDKALRECINGAMKESQINDTAQLKTLKCHNKSIVSVTGIHGLTNLQSLSLYGNDISHADFTALQQLTYLNIANNNLLTLKIHGLDRLETLYAFKNNLTTIDFNGLTSLSKVRIMQNQLVTLDITPLESLKEAFLWDNKLEDLQISGLKNLRFLDVKQNPMPDELYDFYDEQVGITISHDGNADDWK